MPEGDHMMACVTFDVDLVAYASSWRDEDEIESSVPEILRFLRERSWLKTTWFLRLDENASLRAGGIDRLLAKYKLLMERLIFEGHEVGWHPHCYDETAEGLTQQLDSARLCTELRRYAPIARSLGMSSVRMGWGHHTNQTMKLVANHGFRVDSSAIPRPLYDWEETYRDWRGSPRTAFLPSVDDYRKPGKPSLGIMELPISVGVVRAPYDSGQVLRYLNPAFHPSLLSRAIEDWWSENDLLVTITHPYELAVSKTPHGLLSFDMHALCHNLEEIKRPASFAGREVSFCTLREAAETLEGRVK